MTATAGALPVSQLRDEIFDRMDELSPAEKKVARSLLANYPAAGLASAAALARGRRAFSPAETARTNASQIEAIAVTARTIRRASDRSDGQSARASASAVTCASVV